jgi:hypothetical protein
LTTGLLSSASVTTSRARSPRMIQTCDMLLIMTNNFPTWKTLDRTYASLYTDSFVPDQGVFENYVNSGNQPQRLLPCDVKQVQILRISTKPSTPVTYTQNLPNSYPCTTLALLRSQHRKHSREARTQSTYHQHWRHQAATLPEQFGQLLLILRCLPIRLTSLHSAYAAHLHACSSFFASCPQL